MQPNEPVTSEQTQPVPPPVQEQQFSAPVHPAQQPVAPPIPPLDSQSVQSSAPEQQAPVEQPAVPPVADRTPQLENAPVSLEEESSQEPTSLPEVEPVTWQAEEYLQHDKTPLWYVGFTVVVVAFMGLAIWLSAWTFVVLIPVMAVALMVYTHRPARLVNYSVSSNGFHINDQLHPMGEFKAFGVVQDNEVNTLMLIPVKRFRPGINVYFPTEIGESLVDVLGAYLPMQELHPDVFDKIIRKLHI